jgi:hypothetical protein
MPAVNYQIRRQPAARGQPDRLLARTVGLEEPTLTTNPDVIYVMPFFNLPRAALSRASRPERIGQ